MVLGHNRGVRIEFSEPTMVVIYGCSKKCCSIFWNLGAEQNINYLHHNQKSSANIHHPLEPFLLSSLAKFYQAATSVLLKFFWKVNFVLTVIITGWKCENLCLLVLENVLQLWLSQQIRVSRWTVYVTGSGKSVYHPCQQIWFLTKNTKVTALLNFTPRL